MSNLHAYANTCDDLIPPASFDAIGALQRVGMAAIASLRAAVEQRWAQRRIARFSQYMLRDVGFERDWDGTVRPLHDAD